MTPIGFGNSDYRLAVYIANRPPIDHYPNLASLQSLAPGELAHIAAHTSNHWRKAFSVYAKILKAITWYNESSYPTWQSYRDQQLLQAGANEALLFSPPDFNQPNCVHIIAGKTYAAELTLGASIHWLDSYFAIDKQRRLIISPYLDYRQLSNERIDYLAHLFATINQ